jgi:hypothetical protein
MALIRVLEGRLYLPNITTIIEGIASPAEYGECLIFIVLAERAGIFDVQPLPYTSLVVQMAALRPAVGKIVETDCAVLLLDHLPHVLTGRQPFLIDVYCLHLKTVEGSIGLRVLFIVVVFLASSCEAGIALAYKHRDALVEQYTDEEHEVYALSDLVEAKLAASAGLQGPFDGGTV